MKRVSIDFEFSNPQEPHPTLVCCSLNVEGEQPEEYWLLDSKPKQNLLCRRLESLQDCEFVAHASIAEARCFIALGLDPTHFTWSCTYLMRKQLCNKSNKFSYGRYFDANGVEKRSVPPSFQTWKNTYTDNTELRASLAVAVGFHLGICIDTKHKDEMRDIIISGDRDRINANKDAIQEYCTSDIQPLFQLADVMLKEMESHTNMSLAQCKASIRRHGRFAADTAWMEHYGIPIDVPAVKNLVDNYEEAKDELIADLVENHYPFYVKEFSKTVLGGEWKFKASAVKDFVELKGLTNKWPKTSTGAYKTDDETLDMFSTLSEIRALRECNKQVNQLKWFRPDSDSGFFESIGSDGNLRTFLNIFGTASSRNAAPAKRFPFAMSSWLRAIIKPPKGEVIIAKDWGSQEVAIAAVLASDEKMQQAYISGDPYCFLGQQAGAIPMDANKKWVKNPMSIIWNHLGLTPEEIETFRLTSEIEMSIKSKTPSVWDEFLAYKKHSHQRGLFKACICGESYILTEQRGFIKLKELRLTDKVWNGSKFCSHCGLLSKGDKQVIEVDGVNMTPDHKVSTKEGWVDAEKLHGKRVTTSAGASWADVWKLACSILRSRMSRDNRRG